MKRIFCLVMILAAMAWGTSAVAASFTNNPAYPAVVGKASPPVAFYDTSSGSPTSWLWKFGDGNTSTAQNPTHAYPTATTGVYTVSLIASNATGWSTNTVVNDITVQSFTPGDIVVLRAGDGNQNLTNTGNSVFLDEWQFTNNGPNNSPSWSHTFIQTIPMPTNWYGANAPLVQDGTGLGQGPLSLSSDGRFILVTGFGATLGQLTNGPTAVYAADATSQVARVVGLVDGDGHISTSTTQTNATEESGGGDEIRSAVSIDGTNIWFGGNSGGIKYTTRASMLSTQVEESLDGNIRVLGISSNVLYLSANSLIAYATNTAAGVNPFGGSLPTSSVVSNFVQIPGQHDSGGSPFGFVLFNLNGGSQPDTIYISDYQAGTTNNGCGTGGGVWKYSLVSSQWVNNGSITACGAIGLTGRLTYSNSQPVVTLFITEGGTANTSTPAGNVTALYPYIDLTGFNVDPGLNSDGGDATAYKISPFYPSGTPNGDARINTRGVAFAPVGGEFLTQTGTATDSGPGNISVGPPYGFRSVGSAGGPFNTTNIYSIANFGTTTIFVQAEGTPTFNGSPLLDVNFPNGGTVTSLGSVTASVDVNANADSLPTSTNGTFLLVGQTLVRPSILSTGTVSFAIVINSLSFSPNSNYTAVGDVGGPFTPPNYVYVLSNATSGTITWSAVVSNNSSWASISPTSGILTGKDTVNITASIVDSVATNLSAGVYGDELVFSNVTAGLQLTYEFINLQVGFGFFDDFSTYTQNADIVGQNNWNAQSYDTDYPLQISCGALLLTNSTPDTSSQEPWKNIAANNITNSTAYVYEGMMISVISAPVLSAGNTPNYAFATYDETFRDDYADDRVSMDAGSITANGSGGYEWDCHISGIDSWEYGNIWYPYGQTNMVVIVSDVCNSNTWVVVNPTSTNTSYANVPANGGTASPITTGTIAVQDPNYNLETAADGAGADPSAGTFLIGNYYGGAGSTPQPTFLITKVAVSTNWPEVYNFLTNATSLAIASFSSSTNSEPPLTVSFTDTSCGAAPTSWFWTFGDTGTSTSQNPSHTYAAAGMYTVTLIDSNAAGTSIPYTQTIDVTGGSSPFAAWQQYYFPGGGSLSAAGVDVYGTGMSNTNKFLAGFSGTNAAAYLHIISIAKTGGGTNVTVTYLGASGDTNYTPGITLRTNVLEFTTGTGNGSYTNNFQPTGQTNVLGVGLTYDGSGGTGLGTDTNMTDAGGATNVPSRYYRVRVLLP